MADIKRNHKFRFDRHFWSLLKKFLGLILLILEIVKKLHDFL